MKVKYEIIAEVEVEVDNLNDKVTNNWTIHNLAAIVETELKKHACTVNKVHVSRTGATGVTPRVTKTQTHREELEFGL